MVTAFSYIFTSVSFGFFTFNLIIEEGIIKLKCCLLLYSIAYYKLNIKLNIQDSYYYTRLLESSINTLESPSPKHLHRLPEATTSGCRQSHLFFSFCSFLPPISFFLLSFLNFLLQKSRSRFLLSGCDFVLFADLV